MSSTKKHLTWQDVVEGHGTQAGVSVSNGKLNSLLYSVTDTSRRHYTNALTDDHLDYVVPQRRDYITAFSDALQEGSVFPIYQKIKPNHWIHLGNYRVDKELDDVPDEGRLFRLAKVAS